MHLQTGYVVVPVRLKRKVPFINQQRHLLELGELVFSILQPNLFLGELTAAGDPGHEAVLNKSVSEIIFSPEIYIIIESQV